MLTHWIVDSGAPRSIRSVSSATFTIVVSRIDMIAPITTTTAILRTSRGSPATIRPRPRRAGRRRCCAAERSCSATGASARRPGRGMSEVATSATTAATALIAKASVKPCSAGKRPSRITMAREQRGRHLGSDRAADRAHDRVDAGGHAGLVLAHGLDHEVGHRGEGQADADAHEQGAEGDLGERLVEERQPHVGQHGEAAAQGERQARAEARAEPARQRPGAEHHQRARQQQQARHRGGLAEAVPGHRREAPRAGGSARRSRTSRSRSRTP